jgi:parallel beta-helix repeat protein
MAIANHSWNEADTYHVKATAYDSAGMTSQPSPEKKVRIFWLVKILPDISLQPVINNAINQLKSNITFLLEGSNYNGTLNITDVSYINISSNMTQTSINRGSSYCKYIIGLENSNNITINRLNITNGFCGLYLHNCSFCRILNNSICFQERGIHISKGKMNSLYANHVKKSILANCSKECAGVTIEDSLNNTIKCNTIEGLHEDNYVISNSTFKEFSLVSPFDGVLDFDGCCYSFNIPKSNSIITNDMLNCSTQCVYLNENNQGKKLKKLNCSCNISFGVCE